MEGKKIVVLGSTDTDMVAAGARIPVIGETVPGGTFTMTPGGKGANQAVAVARLAAPGTCVFIAKVGDDNFGRETAVRFKKEGMDAKLIVDPVNPTGTAIIFVDPEGRNSIRVVLGANGTLSPADADAYAAEIEGADTVLLQFETPLETVAAVAARAHRAGARVVVNPAPAAEMPASLYADADILTPNETEAQILTGVEVRTLEDAQHAANVFLEKGVKNVVITMGALGAFATDGKKSELLPRLNVNAIDTTGAGDAFNGGFVMALSEEKDLFEALRYGNVTGALSVTKLGTAPSMPMRSEIDAFMKESYGI